MTKRTTDDMMADIEAALNRSNTFDALRHVVTYLKAIGTTGSGADTDTDLSDEVGFFKNKAAEQQAAGDTTGAKKSKGKAAMLKSAEVLVEEASDDKTDDTKTDDTTK